MSRRCHEISLGGLGEFRVPRNSREGRTEGEFSGGGRQRKMLGAATHSLHCPGSEEQQNPGERNEKAKEFRALEQGFHCPCLTQQFVPGTGIALAGS